MAALKHRIAAAERARIPQSRPLPGISPAESEALDMLIASIDRLVPNKIHHGENTRDAFWHRLRSGLITQSDQAAIDALPVQAASTLGMSSLEAADFLCMPLGECFVEEKRLQAAIAAGKGDEEWRPSRTD